MTFVISAFQMYVLHFGHFFRKPEKLGSHTGSKWWPGDPVTRTWKTTQMTHWPGDPMTQFHVWSLHLSGVRPPVCLSVCLSLCLSVLAWATAAKNFTVAGRSIAARHTAARRAVDEYGQCHVVSVRSSWTQICHNMFYSRGAACYCHPHADTSEPGVRELPSPTHSAGMHLQ